jgi:hypothetical protein
LKNNAGIVQNIVESVSTYTQANGIVSSSTEAAVKVVGSEPAGYPKSVQKDVYTTLQHHSSGCKCELAFRGTHLATDHCFRLLLRPRPLPQSSNMARFHFLISSIPSDFDSRFPGSLLPYPIHSGVRPSRSAAFGCWQEVELTAPR